MKRKDIVVRIRQADFGRIERLFAEAEPDEAQCFLLCSRARGPREEVYIGSYLVVPGPDDLEQQSGGAVAPTARFQAIVYGLAADLGLSVVDFHSHPFAQTAHLSGIDFHHGTENARYVAKKMPPPSTMGMVVLARGARSFDGRIWDREDGRFLAVDSVEVLGSPTLILPEVSPASGWQDLHARAQIIPGWNQGLLGQLKVFLVGLCGNGSLVFMSLASLGVGSDGGWIKACDPDLVEASNIPRIPYATPRDIGRSKAQIARTYAARKAPGARVRCYRRKIQCRTMMNAAKEAHLLIGAVDSEGARKTLNATAVRYSIPYIDVATEIIPGANGYEAVGQVHVLVPGEGGCLMCAGLIDPTEAALDMLSDEQRAEQARAGYIRGTDQTPTPSVLHLNGVTSHLAVSQMLRLVFGEAMVASQFLHYERQSCRLLAARAVADEACPVCGTKGYLGHGDDEPADSHAGPKGGRTITLSRGRVADPTPAARRRALKPFRAGRPTIPRSTTRRNENDQRQ